MQLIATLSKGFERLLELIVIVILISLVVVVVMGFSFRRAGAALVWYDEIASIMLAWLTYYGPALAALKRAHIGFSGVLDATPLPWRMVLLVIGEILVIGFFALLAYMGWFVLTILVGDTLVSVRIPVQYTQSVIPIGAALFIIAQLLSLPEAWKRARAGITLDAEVAQATEAGKP